MVIATEAFESLLTVMLRARQAPDSLALVIQGNPEHLNATALIQLADAVVDSAVHQLAGGARSHELISTSP